MDTFMFRYENILKLRLDEEDQCKNELGKRLKELQDLKQGLAREINRMHKNNKEIQSAMASGCTVIQLREMEAEKKWLKETIENQKRMIELKEKDIIKARIALSEASKRRKIMEKLKENEYEEFLKEQEMKEELVSDQIVTYKDSVKRNT